MTTNTPETAHTTARSAVAAGLDELAHLAVRNAATPRDISFTTASTLSRLERQGARRLTSLAVDEGVAQPSMTQLIQRLEQQGLVVRNRDAADRRVVWVAITDAGRALLAKRRKSRADQMAELLAGLDPQEEAAISAAVLAAIPVLRRLAERQADTTT